MTYSQMVKEELMNPKFHCTDCEMAMSAGMLMGASGDLCEYQSDQEEIVFLLTQALVASSGIVATVQSFRPEGKKGVRYRLHIEDREDRLLFLDRFAPMVKRGELVALPKDCCKRSFLSGLFLSCGVLVNPQKEYHFEFKLPGKVQGETVLSFVSQIEPAFKLTKRKTYRVVYLKGSEQIEEILTYIGAQKTAMELMQVKLVKDLRNKINRQTNCETANLDKTVKASIKQIRDIEYIIETKGEAYLPEQLREIAQCRLANPDESLTELVKLLPFTLSRSGLNHRLRKLSELAENLRQQQR